MPYNIFSFPSNCLYVVCVVLQLNCYDSFKILNRQKSDSIELGIIFFVVAVIIF